MRTMIDRTRYPVLVTYSDEGQGHTGHVYKCSGWKPTVKYFVNDSGKRASSYSNGRSGSRGLKFGGITVLQRWEQWICEYGKADEWMKTNGWAKVPIIGKKWRSGSQAFRYERNTTI